jgi:riboflavin kinase/FMN adenylyltransferase
VKVYRNLEAIAGIRNPVVTTGSFDGVHLGHRAILKRIKRLAREIGGETVLITFDPHPRKVLFPESASKNLKLITSQKEKISLLEKTGLDILIILPFTKAFSRMSSADFVKNILVNRIRVKIVVIGFNHHFGHNREGNVDYLYQMGDKFGFRVEQIPEQELHHETISSTKIRKALSEGNIQQANAYLGYRYHIKGILRNINIANDDNGNNWYQIEIEEACKLTPPNGLYVISTCFKGVQYKGLAEIVDQPDHVRVCLHHKQVRVCFFGLKENIHGQFMAVLFAGKLYDDQYIKSKSTRERALKNAAESVKALLF